MGKHITRRGFVSGAAATLAFAAASPLALGQGGGKPGLRLRGAGYRFPRTEALFNGKQQVEGAETRFETAAIGDINSETFSGSQPWDITEIGLHPFMLAYDEGFRDYSLIPAYPLRLFRHKSIFIRNDRGIRSPQDLNGKRIATPGYSSTSLTWIRGILQDEYGVKPTDIEWVTSRKDSSADVAGKASAQESMVPDGISMSQGPEGMDESELLVAGEVDALFHAAVPRAFIEGHPKVARLFADSRATEQDYYRKTGIFPIMHAVAVRKSLLDEHEGLAASIFNAYSRAKEMAYRQMAGVGWAADMLPWYGQEMEATTAVMGANFYSYGLPENRMTLETLFRYSHDQGLASRRLTVEELFHPTALTLTEQTD
jgi:4,5-dihydroxyphthalate decarboxylase